MGDYGFYNLDSLTSVSLPNATYVGRMAFGSDSYSGNKLESISLPNAKTTADYAFSYFRSLKTIEIGNLETLGQRAFYGCSALTSISIPKVSVISEYSFSGCSVRDGNRQAAAGTGYSGDCAGRSGRCDSLGAGGQRTTA